MLLILKSNLILLLYPQTVAGLIIYKSKSFFRKIKLNKQPSILDKSYARNLSPYSELTDHEINLKCEQLQQKEFLTNLNKILEKESSDYSENQSQEIKLEEETIYSQKLNYNCILYTSQSTRD